MDVTSPKAYFFSPKSRPILEHASFRLSTGNAWSDLLLFSHYCCGRVDFWTADGANLESLMRAAFRASRQVCLLVSLEFVRSHGVGGHGGA